MENKKAVKKMDVRFSPRQEDFQTLLNCLLQSGFDFYTDKSCTTIRMFFKDESGFTLDLDINGTWKIS